jgi:hypothetical protein
VAPYPCCTISPEVMPFAALATLNELGSPGRVKETGLLKLAGRDYPVANGDILLLRFQRCIPFIVNIAFNATL